MLARQLETGRRLCADVEHGSLFDAMSSLAGVCHRVAYEAEAAMRFEGLARNVMQSGIAAYSFGLNDDPAGPAQLDPGPVIAAAAADVQSGRRARRDIRAVSPRRRATGDRRCDAYP